MNDLDLYQRMYDEFLKCTSLSKAEAQVAIIKVWNDSKRDYKDDKSGFESFIVSKIQEYQDKSNEIANNRSISLLSSHQVVEVITQTSEDDEESYPSTSGHHNSGLEDHSEEDEEEELCWSMPDMIINGAHAQSKVANDIVIIRSELQSLYKKRSLHSLTNDEARTLTEKEETLRHKTKELRKLEQGQKRQIKYREKRKQEMSNLFENHPELKKEIPSLHEKRGRPRLDDQPQLLKTIAEIAIHGSTEDKRRSETLMNVKTLEKLSEELNKLGITVSQSGVYMRLIHRKNDLTNGKRRIATVPVMLTGPSNTAYINHHDEKFCTASLQNLKELASLLGPNQVFFLSQNTKARVPIGLSVAHKDAPLLMHMEYKATLPDDWAVSPQHKLVPSVYSGIVVKENCFNSSDAVTYSGPTYVAIRSGKHSSPTTCSQAKDLQTLMDLPEFDKLGRIFEGGPSKPIFIIFVDGGPDEIPRYEKVIQTGIHHFIDYNLDALFIAANSPGKSAFDHVERRLAPLSRELTGVILPNETYGSHLDDNGKTINEDLEKTNLQYAGETLAEIWSSMVLDGYSVCANYIPIEKSDVSDDFFMQKDMGWRSKHVRESQYFTQIVKCLDRSCCTSTRSDFFKIIPNRFLPPPLPLIQTTNGLGCPQFPISNPDNQTHKFPSLFVNLSMNGQDMLPLAARSFRIIPYDLYCPTTQSQLLKRICKRCSLYHSSLTRLTSHMKAVCFNKEVIAPMVRPLCIVARRQKEILALLTDNGDLEWVDEEQAEWDLNMEDDILGSSFSSAITTVKKHISTPWENKYSSR